MLGVSFDGRSTRSPDGNSNYSVVQILNWNMLLETHSCTMVTEVKFRDDAMDLLWPVKYYVVMYICKKNFASAATSWWRSTQNIASAESMKTMVGNIFCSLPATINYQKTLLYVSIKLKTIGFCYLHLVYICNNITYFPLHVFMLFRVPQCRTSPLKPHLTEASTTTNSCSLLYFSPPW